MLQKYLDELEKIAAKGDFEAYEVMEQLENFTPAQIEAFKQKNPQLFAQMINRFKSTGRAIPQNVIIAGNVAASALAAQLDIVLTVTSDAGKGNLEVYLFNELQKWANYRGLSQGLGAQHTVFVEQVTTGRHGFAYADGGNNQTIFVSAIQQQYTAFMNALKTDKFSVFKMRLKTDNAMAGEVFSMNISHYTKTLFGKADFNSIPVASQESPMQYKTNILDIDCKFDISKENGLYMVIPYDFAAKSSYLIGVSLFINNFSSLR